MLKSSIYDCSDACIHLKGDGAFNYYVRIWEREGVHQNASVCEQGQCGVTSVQTFTYIFLKLCTYNETYNTYNSYQICW